MKATYFLIAMITMMSLASCAADGNDPTVDDSINISTYYLERTYGARSVAYTESSSDELSLSDLPSISLSEAEQILSSLRKHTNAKEEQEVLAADKGEQKLLKIIMTQTINNKYTFTIQLNMSSYADGSLYYGGYEAKCSSSLMKWYLKGFSLSSDGTTGNYKFEAQSYLYIKVVDNGIKYMQIPISIKGTYNPVSHQGSFTYSL